jgi:hypothetical protein
VNAPVSVAELFSLERFAADLALGLAVGVVACVVIDLILSCGDRP